MADTTSHCHGCRVSISVLPWAVSVARADAAFSDTLAPTKGPMHLEPPFCRGGIAGYLPYIYRAFLLAPMMLQSMALQLLLAA